MDLGALFKQLSTDSKINLRSLTLRESLIGFFHAINWKERNILALLVFHVVLLLVVVRTRRSVEAQALILILVGGIVSQAERANALLATNWRTYGFSQNYFDKSGVFMMSMVSAPLLAIAVLQVVLMLSQANNLLVQLKVTKMRAEARDKAKAKDYDELPKKTM